MTSNYGVVRRTLGQAEREAGLCGCGGNSVLEDVTRPSKIGALTVAPLAIPLFEPIGISGGAQTAANNVLATLELADGTRGYGVTPKATQAS